LEDEKVSKLLAVKDEYISVEDYLKLEEKSKIRHEYMDGKIFSMAGGTRKHSLAGTNISTELSLQVREKDWEVHAGELRIRMRGGHFVYPDVAVACGEILTEDNDKTLLNPIVIFEVLSKSTEKRDRSEKAEDYFKLDSLKDYVLVSQYRVRVEHFSRQKNNEWSLKIYESLDDTLDLKSIECTLSLKLIYLKLKLPPLTLVEKKKRNGK